MDVSHTTQDSRAVILRFFDEYLAGQRDEVLGELVAPQFVNPHSGLAGAEGMASGTRFLRQTFGDARFTVHDVIAEGDRVAVRWTLRGRQVAPFHGAPPTGRLVDLPAMSIYRLAGGRIVESWVQTGALREVEAI
jgi:predicted ester cyclase